MTELSKRQTAAEAEKHQAGVAKNADAIFNSPRGVTLGNKDGDVTFVEFFDYNCGYCKRAMTDMIELMKADPKLKVVLKEFPVLARARSKPPRSRSPCACRIRPARSISTSTRSCSAAAGQADKARAMAAAKEVGLDMAKLEKDLASPEVRATLEENFKLAEAMGMNGTPSYVIGKQVVIGAVGVETLQGKDQHRPLRQGDLLTLGCGARRVAGATSFRGASSVSCERARIHSPWREWDRPHRQNAALRRMDSELARQGSRPGMTAEVRLIGYDGNSLSATCTRSACSDHSRSRSVSQNFFFASSVASLLLAASISSKLWQISAWLPFSPRMSLRNRTV